MYSSDNAIDISGVPHETIFVAMTCFNNLYKAEVIREFYKEFPRLKSPAQKGNRLSPIELKKIILFLDEHKVKMYTICFKKEEWKRWRDELKQHGHQGGYIEKIIATLIYRLLKNYCFVGKVPTKNGGSYWPEYNVVIDEKSNFNMDNMFENCRRLCRGRNIRVSFSKAKAKFSETIKFSDYLASAYRKLGEAHLKELENCKVVPPEFSELEAYRVFKQWKWTAEKNGTKQK